MVLVLSLSLVASAATAADQDDAGTGGDAGDTFETATLVEGRGRVTGSLDHGAGDTDDVYRFPVSEGSSLSVVITLDASTTDPVTLLDPDGVVVDVGANAASLGVSVSPVFATGAYGHELGTVRLAVHRARLTGEYRLHLRAHDYDLRSYELCFMNCEQPQTAPIEMIFGGSLRQTDTRVLLVPPSHGDLSNPLGPTVVDYMDATLRGIRNWIEALHDFAKAYPRYSYLDQITVHVEIFDGVSPVDPAGYDVVLGYVAAGPSFRGVATQLPFSLDDPRFSGRAILLSLYGSAPRSGQVAYDSPEINDLEMVTMHEFGHTFGLGHTTTIHPTLGFDLMNSPAPFVYGDGSPVGDGGERTGFACLSSLALYGMAHLYRWVPQGNWLPSFGSRSLPSDIPYTLFCPDHIT